MRYGEKYLSELDRVCSALDFSTFAGTRILMTGGTGLIGSAIADALLYANEKLGLELQLQLAVRSEEKARARFSRFRECSALSFGAYNALAPVHLKFQADFIIHGASNAHPAIYSKEPVETLLANVTGTEGMLRFAREIGAKRLLYISSSEVYGRISEVRAYREEDSGYVELLNPRACYPTGKRAAETLCAAYGAEYGVDFVIARPGHIYGPTMTPSDTRATAQFARDVLAGRDILMKSAGMQLRSYCYGADCAAAILTMLQKGRAGEAYNISDRNSVVSIRQMAEEFAAAAGKKVVFALPTDEEQKSYNLMDNSSLNGEKLEALGWKPIFDYQSGVRNMLEIMREEEEI